MNKIMEALEKTKTSLELQGYSVVFLAIYGSQNYALDLDTSNYKSDIDIKAIVVPSLEDLISNSKPVSKVLEYEDGQCDVKDIRSYFTTLLKGNPAYLETIFTDYYLVDDNFKNEFEEIFNLREDLVRALSAQLIRAMYGMMKEKEKALCHPYPTIKHKIDKYGYCGKQLSHSIRLLTMMEDYFDKKKSFKDSLKPGSRKGEILSSKLNEPSLDEAKLIMKDTIEEGKAIRDRILSGIDESKIDYSVKYTYQGLANSIIRNKIVEKIEEGVR